MLRAFFLIACAAVVACAAQQQDVDVGDTFAVIVSSSRYWFNYRHNADALAIYHAVRRLGLPDTHIILMLADNPACSPHNPTPGRVYARKNDRFHGDVFSEDTQVDYSGAAVTADALLRVLTGRHRPGTPNSRRLAMGPRSRLLLYLTGHGGDGFLKFHDREELAAEDLATALSVAEAASRFGEALIVLDTCQAATLTEPLRTVAGDAKPTWRQDLQRPENSEGTGGLFYGLWEATTGLFPWLLQGPKRVPPPRSHVGIITLSSSERGEDSFAAGVDEALGMAVADEFSELIVAALREELPPAFDDGREGLPAVWDPGAPAPSDLPVSSLGYAYQDTLRADWGRWRGAVTPTTRDGGVTSAQAVVPGAIRSVRLAHAAYCGVPGNISGVAATASAAASRLSPERAAAASAWCCERHAGADRRREAMSEVCAAGAHVEETAASAACTSGVRAVSPARLYDPGPHLAVPALDALRRRNDAAGRASVSTGRAQSLLALWAVLPHRRISSTIAARVDLAAEERWLEATGRLGRAGGFPGSPDPDQEGRDAVSESAEHTNARDVTDPAVLPPLLLARATSALLGSVSIVEFFGDLDRGQALNPPAG